MTTMSSRVLILLGIVIGAVLMVLALPFLVSAIGYFGVLPALILAVLAIVIGWKLMRS